MTMELGTYRLIERLGAGGMGEVWRAEDRKLLRHVAIKILPPQLAADAEWKERFFREARTIASLNHPNIATIYGIDEHEGQLFIAMELIEGEPLSSVIARGPLASPEAVRIAMRAADGLGEAHHKGIVHRDIKPDNILVSKRVVKVLDFGIAKNLAGTADPSLTQGGMVMGTPHYMSPEQAMGRAVDARTDIFSLGVVLYEMLSGARPFTGVAATEVLLQIVMKEPRDIGEIAPGITSSLANIVRRCMHKQPAERFASCEALHDALETALREDPAPRTPRQSDIATVSDRKPVSVRSSGSKKALRRALVADDDPATRYLLGSVLQRHHIAFDEAANGAEAVKLLKSNEYALLFIDLLMPRIDGWGVLDYLRTHKPKQMPRTYIITGVLNQKLSTADHDLVTALIYKPLDVDQVEKLVTA